MESAVLDGEIACLDEQGRSVFRNLLFRRGQCVFIAFDLLFLNGKDLRPLPLIERKIALRKLLTRRKRARILSVRCILSHCIKRKSEANSEAQCRPVVFE